MRKLLSIFIAIATILSMCTIGYANDKDITDALKNNMPNNNTLTTLLTQRTAENVQSVTFTDPNMIHRLYNIKNDGNLERSMFEHYDGSFYNEFDYSTEIWQIPVVSNEKIIGEYSYSIEDDELLEDEYSNVKNDIGLGMIYSIEKLTNIIDNANIGTPTDIKSAYITFPQKAIFIYIKTDKGEYIVPTNTVKLSYFNENNKYTSKTVFSPMTVYTADELVAAYKTALDDREKWEIELDNNNKNEDVSYVDDNGDVIIKTPTPTISATQSPMLLPTPQPTSTPVVNETPTPTKIPSETMNPMSEPISNPNTLIVTNTENVVSIAIDKKVVNFDAAQPFIDSNNRTQVPVRAISEMLNADVDWNNDTQTVTITRKSGEKIEIIIGSNIINIDGKKVSMDTKAVIVSDYTYIPIRFIAEGLGMTVEWK